MCRNVNNYWHKSVNGFQENNRHLLWKLYETYKYTVWAKCKILGARVDGTQICHRALSGLGSAESKTVLVDKTKC